MYDTFKWVIYMKEMDILYTDLKLRREKYRSQLEQYRKRLEKLPEQKYSIIIKTIHGEPYYYAQFRREGKVRSQYIGAVRPGLIADAETSQEELNKLKKKIKELEWNIESLDKMIDCLKRRQRKESILDNFQFEVYWKDEITARVYVKGKDVVVSRFTDNPLKQLFAAKKMSRVQLGEIFELRCWERGREDINEILGYIGVEEYNPYEIVRKTHGVSVNDCIWFRFPGEKLCSTDVLVR